MADTILSAQMSDSELFSSIDKELGKCETRFGTFASNVNKTLDGINVNLGQGLAKNFGSQIDAMSQKIKELETQAKSIKIGSNNQSTAPTTLNVNDLNNYSASVSTKSNPIAANLSQMNSEMSNSLSKYDELTHKIQIAKSEQEKLTIENRKYGIELDRINNTGSYKAGSC